MRIIDCRPRSEEWDAWRCRPTASEFFKFCSAVRGEYSEKTAAQYAAKIVAKQLGVYIERPPTDAMQWGIDHEPTAKAAYEAETGREIVEAGFILPDHTDAYGGSPDGLVGEDGLIEVKCPAAETLLYYLDCGVLPAEYRPQVQGLLMISGRAWCDFWAWHPNLPPLLVRVECDLEYQEKIAEGLLKLLQTIERIKEKLSWKP